MLKRMLLNGDGVNKPTGIFDSKKGGELGLTTRLKQLLQMN